ncbi:cytochrome ubiquinol oxidase subunit I [Rhodanobacter sp. DHG33]|nr:cytochrome ubiquinol oxidase subunit I [Rhodanobacter sp. DHG33]
MYCIALFGVAFWLASRRRLDRRGFLRFAAWSPPVPWVAGALGWLVSEAGRGPWLIDGLLPVTEAHATGVEVIIGTIAYTTVTSLFVACAVDAVVRKHTEAADASWQLAANVRWLLRMRWPRWASSDAFG